MARVIHSSINNIIRIPRICIPNVVANLRAHLNGVGGGDDV